MKPCVSPASRARPTRVIGMRAISAGLPLARTSFSLMPMRASGGSVNRAYTGMRWLTRRGSLSNRFALTISKSLYDVCVKAPRPLQSPRAQTPAALVLRNWSSTVTKPRASVAMSAASRPRPAVLGVRPTASSRCEPTTSGSPLSHDVCTRTPFAPSRATDRHFALARMTMPSRSSTCATAVDTSSSSRAMMRGPISHTVTFEPKRRKICANSRPM